jgi:hypothetical protein
MADRIHSFTVFLAYDVSQEMADDIQKAMAHFRGVTLVEQNVSDITTRLAEARARRELGDAMWEVLYPKEKGHA